MSAKRRATAGVPVNPPLAGIEPVVSSVPPRPGTHRDVAERRRKVNASGGAKLAFPYNRKDEPMDDDRKQGQGEGREGFCEGDLGQGKGLMAPNR